MNTVKKYYKPFIFALFLFGIGISGCKNEFWDDSEKITFNGSPDIVSSVKSVNDSIVNFTYTVLSEGWFSYVILPGEVAEIPDSSEILQNTVSDAIASGNFKVTADNLTGTISVSDLEQNSQYTLFAVSTDKLGVISNVSGPTLFTTGDIHAPELLSESPSISQSGVVSGTNVKLTFNENVKVTDASKIYFIYYNRISIHMDTIPADKITVSGATITIVSAKGLKGQLGFLAIDAGAITDIIGLPFGGIKSGLIGGLPKGYYWRFETETFTYTSTLPVNGDTVTDAGFSFKFKFNKRLRSTLLASYTEDMIKVKYETEDYSSLWKIVPDANLIISVADSSLTVQLPIAPVSGQDISLIVAEGAIVDIYGNPIQAITAGETVDEDELHVHFK